MDAGYTNEARALFAKFVATDADVHLRSLAMKAKCEELERALQFVDTMHERRAKARDARLLEAKSQDAQTQQMQESIQGAIQRARKIREALAKRSDDAGDAGDDDDDGDDEGGDDDTDGITASPSLQNILAMAKTIRAQCPLDGTNRAARTPTSPTAPAKEAGDKSLSVPAPELESIPASPQIQLEYPRRMKLLLDQLRDIEEKESHESFRFVFFRKMTEHLSLDLLAGAQADEKRNTVQSLNRVQVGYPMQLARLQHGYTLVRNFMTQRVDVSSKKFQDALHSPSLSTVFPIYTRVKQGKQMMRALNEETKALAERVPPPPKLSPAAIAHRDAMLTRLTKQSSNRFANSPEAVSNANLLSFAPEAAITDHRSALERLQAAWEASEGATKSDSSVDSVFEATLKEIVLTDTSNLILSFFKTIFCDNPDDPEPVHVKNMLLLIRLVDSVAMTNGRRLRSAISSAAS